jgi:nucleoside 2-deoxyribosyltransferase
MKKRIYLAAPWVRRDEARAAGELIEAAGHTITKKWWEHRDVPIDQADRHLELEQQAIEDLEGVFRAQVFVLLNLATSEGKAVETGLALAYGKPIILVGERSNLFHYLVNPAFRVPTIEEAIVLAGQIVT